MAKTNFSKVESALDEGLRRMTVDKLCQLADIAAGIGQPSGGGVKLTQAHRQLMRQLKIDLARLRKKDSKIYAKLKIKKTDLDQMFEEPEKIQESDWHMLEELRSKTKTLVQEYYPKTSDTELIEEEQEKHMNKRFNVSDKWLPM